MALATGILTASGGRTSHAAVVARQLGKVSRRLPRARDRYGAPPMPDRWNAVERGRFLSLDGNSGAVYPRRLAP
ncbi:PEP-utilizing enzyme [Methylocella tundrae]|uniref:PEP-utilizing enzyme n=1 Tax=Methylocella tundrae TaxID=227605 RepID=UPI00106D0279